MPDDLSIIKVYIFEFGKVCTTDWWKDWDSSAYNCWINKPNGVTGQFSTLWLFMSYYFFKI